MSKTVTRRTPPVGGKTYVEKLDYEEFAKRLYHLLVQRGWKQSDLARRCFGEVRSTKGHMLARGRDRISAYIRGKAVPDPSNLKKIADAFEITVEELAPDIAQGTMEREEPSLYVHAVPGTGKVLLKTQYLVPQEYVAELIALNVKYGIGLDPQPLPSDPDPKPAWKTSCSDCASSEDDLLEVGEDA